MDVQFFAKFAPEKGRIFFRYPLQVRDFVDRTNMGIGIAMTVETPAHGDGFHNRDHIHAIDSAVTRDTGNTSRDVSTVVEEDEVG